MKYIYLFLFIIIILFSCSNYAEKNNNISLVDSTFIFSQNFNYSQKFYTSTDTVTFVKGKNGTQIECNPEVLETVTGNELSDEIEIELIELSTQKDFFLHNISTVSNGYLIVSGGAYYINMTSGGEKLRIKNGESLNVIFPKYTDEDMQLFYGDFDENGVMNWNPEEQFFSDNIQEIKSRKKPIKPIKPFFNSEKKVATSISFSDDSTIVEEYDFILTEQEKQQQQQQNKNALKEYNKKYDDYLVELQDYEEWYEQNIALRTYDAMQIHNLGWINCDRFLNSGKDLHDYKFFFNNNSFTNLQFYVIYHDINSILIEPVTENSQNFVVFKNMPLDYEITVVGIGVNNDVPYIYKEETNTSNESLNKIDLTETTIDEIENLNFSQKRIINKLYPNPAEDIINIEFNTQEIYNIEILNSTGKVVLSDSNTDNHIQIQITNLKPGIHYLRVRNKKVTATEQFIKK